MRNDTLSATPIADYISTRGWRHYELSNHLGNVQATVADYIQGDDDNNAEVEVYSSQDYYAFGMVMPGRSYTFTGNSSLNRYRFGFNGMEMDNDVSGYGNSYTTAFRQNDPRLGGRWWSIDPIVKPWKSPYAGYANNPVYYIDPSGLDPSSNTSENDGNGITLPETVVTDNARTVPVELRVNILKLNIEANCHIDISSYNKMIYDINLENQRRYDALDHANGQVMEPRNIFWDILLGQRIYQAGGRFDELVDEGGYLTGQPPMIGGTPFIPVRGIVPMKLLPSMSPSPADLARAGQLRYANALNRIDDAGGGTILTVENSPYLIVQKGDRTFHISPDRVKEYVRNPLNPNSRWGDQVNFKRYGVPEGSEIIKGAGKGHKRTPTQRELNMFNNFFNK